MLDELRTAALLGARRRSRRRRRFRAHDWLRAATLGGARALGLAEVIGSLVAGQMGRPVLHRSGARRIRSRSTIRPRQLLFAASRDQVSDVWVAGRALVPDGQLTHLDLEDVLRSRRSTGTNASRSQPGA